MKPTTFEPAESPRKGIGQKGFTLLEIIVCLAIITVLGTMFAVRFAGESSGDALREPAGELRKMALTANRRAAAFRDEYRITFFPDAFFLSQAPIFERPNAEERAIQSYLIPTYEPIKVEIRHMGNPKWIRPTGDEWLFQPAGLCEPLEVRFSTGKDLIELTFNPMTATVEDERFLYQ